MPDDPVPTPPTESQPLPPRLAPFQPIPGSIQFARCNPVDGQTEPLIALFYDSPDVRVVSYWTESAFLALAQRMAKFVGEPAAHLTVADMSDLEKLKDAGPFMEKP